jgi:hypothetical protein
MAVQDIEVAVLCRAPVSAKTGCAGGSGGEVLAAALGLWLLRRRGPRRPTVQAAVPLSHVAGIGWVRPLGEAQAVPDLQEMDMDIPTVKHRAAPRNPRDVGKTNDDLVLKQIFPQGNVKPNSNVNHSANAPGVGTSSDGFSSRAVVLGGFLKSALKPQLDNYAAKVNQPNGGPENAASKLALQELNALVDQDQAKAVLNKDTGLKAKTQATLQSVAAGKPVTLQDLEDAAANISNKAGFTRTYTKGVVDALGDINKQLPRVYDKVIGKPPQYP